MRCSLKILSRSLHNNEIEKIYKKVKKKFLSAYNFLVRSIRVLKSFPLILSLLKSHIQIVSSCYSLNACFCGTTWGLSKVFHKNHKQQLLFTHPPSFAIYFASYRKKKTKFSFFLLFFVDLKPNREKHWYIVPWENEVKKVYKICL